MQTQEFISIYGAIVATVVFLWRVLEWFGEKPRLRIEVKTDMFQDTSGNFLVRDQQRAYTHDKKGIAIEIVNIGKMPTTIKFISIQPYRRLWCFKERHIKAYLFKPHPNEPQLPKILNPGEIWSGFNLDQAEFFALKNKFTLFVEVDHSFSQKPSKEKLVFWEDR